jgi:hypothetical protein
VIVRAEILVINVCRYLQNWHYRLYLYGIMCLTSHCLLVSESVLWYWISLEGRCGRDHMAFGFTTNNAISAYLHWSCEFKSRSWRNVLDTTLWDKVYQWLATDRWFSPGTPVSSTIKTDHHDIAEILLKVALSNITLTITQWDQRKNIQIANN